MGRQMQRGRVKAAAMLPLVCGMHELLEHVAWR